MAGILLFGLSARKAGALCSPLVMFTGTTLYASPISSSATLIFRPFGVFQVWSSTVMRVPRSFGKGRLCSILIVGGKIAGALNASSLSEESGQPSPRGRIVLAGVSVLLTTTTSGL